MEEPPVNYRLTLPHGWVREVCFSLAPGECILLAGPNGCGKTTLLKALAAAGCGAKTSGHPRPDKREGPAGKAGGRGREATVFAPHPIAAKCILIPTGIPKVKGFTLEEFVRTGCYQESNWAGKLNKETQQRLEEALELLGIRHLQHQDIASLSDGEFQKACIAVGLARKADILLLDEPTAFLDPDGRAMVLRTLRHVAESAGITVLFSSHDLHASLAVAHRVLAFTRDRLLESTPENRTDILTAAFPSLSGIGANRF